MPVPVSVSFRPTVERRPASWASIACAIRVVRASLLWLRATHRTRGPDRAGASPAAVVLACTVAASPAGAGRPAGSARTRPSETSTQQREISHPVMSPASPPIGSPSGLPQQTVVRPCRLVATHCASPNPPCLTAPLPKVCRSARYVNRSEMPALRSSRRRRMPCWDSRETRRTTLAQARPGGPGGALLHRHLQPVRDRRRLHADQAGLEPGNRPVRPAERDHARSGIPRGAGLLTLVLPEP